MTSVLTIENESRVNTYTASYQEAPVITWLSGGGYIIAWHSYQEGSAINVYFQRYDSNGDALGAETRANTTTADSQNTASITALTGGGYVVAWQSYLQDGSGYGIYAKVYDASGTAVTAEFRVSTTTAGSQSAASVSGLSDGGFVVAWYSENQDGSSYGVYAQRYDTNGVAQGAETQVNTYTQNSQIACEAAGLTGGGYVVTWSSDGQDGSSYGVYAQVYDQVSAPVGTEFRVNTTTAQYQLYSHVAGLSGGGFVVVWESYGQDGASAGVFAQIYDADGTPAGLETRVNSYTTGTQQDPSVAALGDGGYVIVWESSGQDGSGYGIYAQRFDAYGYAIGPEIQVNSTTAGSQSDPAVAALADGGFVVTWAGEDGSNTGIYRKEFSAASGLTGTQHLYGTAEADMLDGGSGGDMMYGGFGDDVYVVNSAADVVSERSNQGDDEVRSSMSYTLGSDLEYLTLTGSTAINGTGNSAENIIIGNAGNNSLNGASGNDQIHGGLGNDTLNGGSDDDYLDGGSGNDLIQLSAGADFADGGAGIDTLTAASHAYAVTANLVEESVTDGSGGVAATVQGIENLIGSAFADNLTGSNGNNLIDGGAGADTMTGGLGNDSYYVDATTDKVVEASGQGTDIIFSTVTYTLNGRYVETLQLTGLANVNATGNSLGNTLIGNAANNNLNGAGGADTLIGGLGNDTYNVDATTDNVVEAAGEGTDLVLASATYSLIGRNAEHLTLTGSAAINATGNGLGNTLTGNTGNNILNGGAGNDTMTGGLGADYFQFGTGFRADRVTDFNSAQGDKIQLVGLGSYTVTQVGGNVTVDFGGGNIITVVAATAADVSANIV